MGDCWIKGTNWQGIQLKEEKFNKEGEQVLQWRQFRCDRMRLEAGYKTYKIAFNLGCDAYVEHYVPYDMTKAPILDDIRRFNFIQWKIITPRSRDYRWSYDSPES